MEEPKEQTLKPGKLGPGEEGPITTVEGDRVKKVTKINEDGTVEGATEKYGGSQNGAPGSEGVTIHPPKTPESGE